MTFSGSITQIKSRMDASGNKVQTITIEVHGNILELNSLMESPLRIEINPE